MKRDRFLLTLNDDSFDLILYSLIEMKTGCKVRADTPMQQTRLLSDS